MSLSKIEFNQRVIFSGFGKYKLACAANLLLAPNGDLLSTWLSGGDKEPSEDNCVLISRSSDLGKTWSDPEVLLKNEGKMAAAFTSWHTTGDGRIIAFGARWPHDKAYTDWFYFRMESADDGKTWEKREDISFYDDHFCIGCPIRLQNGEYLFPGSFFEPRSTPLHGDLDKLLNVTSEEAAKALLPETKPNGIGKFGTHLHGAFVCIASEETAKDIRPYGRIANRPLGLLEGSAIQLKDGRIVMFLRAEFGGYLWRTESSDNGRTWADAVETDIHNPCTMPYVMRLSSGKIVLLHNAIGEKGKHTVRNPLSVWVSEDELESWSLKQDIIATSGNPCPDWWKQDNQLDMLSYPFGLEINGRLCFVYDRNRRDVLFVETDLQ